MYIHPFAVGVVTTILAEFALLLGWAIFSKNRR